MKILPLLILSLSFQLSLVAQKSFKDYINLFPNYNWSVIPEDIRQLKKGLPIDIDIANECMWNQHASIKLKTKNSLYLRKAPHYMDQDGAFKKGIEGKFDKEINVNDSIVYPKLQPLAKINVNSNILMLLLFYRTWDSESGWTEFYEAYTYRLNDEQLLSSICLWNNKSKGIWISFKKSDIIVLYSTLYYSVPSSANESEEKGSICKISYKLRNDGYFQQLDNIDAETMGIVYWAEVIDKDGWSNVRESPVINSKVLYKVKNEQSILLEKIENSQWYHVICYTDEMMKEYHGGFIHESRVIKLK